MNHIINLKIKKIIIKNSGDLKMVEVEPIKTTVEELRKLVNIQKGKLPWRRKWQPTPVSLPG